MLQEMSPNSPNSFYCNYCNYKCNKKSDMNKHVSTRKHKCNESGNMCNKKLAKNEYGCNICNKIYKSRVGLWRHNKSCNQNKNITNNQNNNEIINENTTNNGDSNMKTLILDIIKNNTDALKEIMNVCKNMNNTTINNSNNNSNNKTFNLQVFLNEECKDAMNLSEFINSLQVQLSDLDNMGSWVIPKAFPKLY
jgi:hypothetical protein